VNSFAEHVIRCQDAYKQGRGTNKRAENLRDATAIGVRHDEINASWDEAELERVANGFSVARGRSWAEVHVPANANKVSALTSLSLPGDRKHGTD
jgi:hypothetical protein